MVWAYGLIRTNVLIVNRFDSAIKKPIDPAQRSGPLRLRSTPRQPGFGVDGCNIAFGQLEPESEHPSARYARHMPWRLALFLGILPHEQAGGKSAEYPPRVMRQAHVWMLWIIAVAIELLQEITTALDRRIARAGTPATPGMKGHRASIPLARTHALALKSSRFCRLWFAKTGGSECDNRNRGACGCFARDDASARLVASFF